MPRLRRYRVFLIFAFIVLALLYHVSKNTSQWERFQMSPGSSAGHSAPVEPSKPNTGPDHQTDRTRPPSAHKPNAPPPAKKPSVGVSSSSSSSTSAPAAAAEPTSIRIPKLKSTSVVKGAYGIPTPKSRPDGVPSTGHHDVPKQKEEGEEDNGYRYADFPPKPTQTSVAHWKKPYEFYPVPEEKLIMLPTGKPKPIPKVQFDFAEESVAAKEKREIRLAQIKAETKKAWTGYKQYAWGHDEVRPVSKGPHDPFCGWAATLVDALDTLWIMGMKTEFEEALEVVKEIDFTTTPYRTDIPVFETIIRYLGGLVGAYDVTGAHGGKYRILLDKAEELAEILMSVFDTPNRMPILYYQWKPESNERPKKASSASGVAEMGSMGMEFTRLAQLTGKNKYYDAIARITDALEDLQNRPGGTAIEGIFPQNIDASGCNQTAMAEKRRVEEEERRVKEEEEARKRKLDEEEEEVGQAPVHKHREGELETDSNGDGRDDLAFEVQPGGRTSHGLKKRGEVTIFRAPGSEEECIPQGLTAPGYGSDSYSMGGSQDSAYEYFPKQYVLLGGLEPKYRTMHEKTVKGVKKYLLFRPQAKGDPDILFSAKAFSPDGTDKALTYEFEVTHLTCFLGGMFGLGGKIFDSPEDVEIGKRLAAGCAWAYEVMPTGIMPEYAQILPCASATDCHFNETEWDLRVDPYMNDRGKQMAEYKKNKADWEEQVAEIEKKNAQLEAEERRKADQEKRAKEAEKRRKMEEEEERSRRPVNNTLPGDDETSSGSKHSSHTVHDLKEKDTGPSLHKRGPIQEGDARSEYSSAAQTAEEKNKKVEGALDFNVETSRRGEKWQARPESPPSRPDLSESSSQRPPQQVFAPPEPIKPQTHEEYMANQNLIPGFTTITDRRYILRPEAIESVYYMYRITGDPVWQDRGWAMWQAVIRAVRTEIGHSAIQDVTSTEKHAQPTDSMESFWLAETLKYFYLLFAKPDVISLDEWVLNTEAHPFRRPI